MIRALIVDDEEPARAKVRALLADAPDLEVVGEAADGERAVEAIAETRPDVVFLDIQMPRLDGFGVIERVGLEEMPLVVFVTAYDEHALRAFDVHAFDYLLKPFAADRMLATVERVRRRLDSERKDDRARRLGRMIEDATPSYLTRVAVERSPHRELLLPASEIRLVRAQRNYVQIFAGKACYMRRGTLAALEQRLDPEQFLRINRSEIVRLDAVREMQPWFHGDYRVILNDGETLAWSRRYRARQRRRFEPSDEGDRR
jgi:two-component system LytT family response regulator